MISENVFHENNLKSSSELPKAVYIGDVEIFMAQKENDETNENKKDIAELVLSDFYEEFSKIKLIELNLATKKKVIKKQLPEIIASLDMIKVLKSKKKKEESTNVHCMISDNSHDKYASTPTDKNSLCSGEYAETTTGHTIMCDGDLYVKAVIPPTGKIYLSLGANVILEYELEDAEELLNKNYKKAVDALRELGRELRYLRKQLTTVEVNMAKVYNWNVRRQHGEKNTNDY